MEPLILTRISELRTQVAQWRSAGERIALVPTMGALHRGHISLCDIARGAAERTIVSIFVNPTQFAPTEDLSRYPRPFEEDVRQLAGAGVDAVFAPPGEEMYPPGNATRIRVSGVSEGLEGSARPTHFEGVATIVAKLFMQAQPDCAVFGEKDYQQLQVVRRLTRDLDLPVEILAGKTVREADGLALSSRNVYLSAQERKIAPRLYQTLQAASFALRDGAEPEDACAAARATLEQCGFKVDYVALCDADTLAPLEKLSGAARLLAAARLGTTRLIDNIAVKRAT